MMLLVSYSGEWDEMGCSILSLNQSTTGVVMLSYAQLYRGNEIEASKALYKDYRILRRPVWFSTLG